MSDLCRGKMFHTELSSVAKFVKSAYLKSLKYAFLKGIFT